MIEEAVDTILYDLDPQGQKHGWSDQYGAFFILSDYTGIKINENKRLYSHFMWMHGVPNKWDYNPPSMLVYFMKNKNFKYLVANLEQKRLLNSVGYKNVFATGVPMLYVKEENVERESGSLLVMPTHGLKGFVGHEKDKYDQYINFVKENSYKFKKICFCIGYHDIQNGHWINECRENGFEIIVGARNNDKKALKKQMILFKSFETMLTDGWGSHVAYALYFGCRVSISGPSMKFSEEDLLKDGTWQRDKLALKNYLSDDTDRLINETLNRFMVLPEDAVFDVEYGKTLLGFDCKKKPAEFWSILRLNIYDITLILKAYFSKYLSYKRR